MKGQNEKITPDSCFSAKNSENRRFCKYFFLQILDCVAAQYKNSIYKDKYVNFIKNMQILKKLFRNLEVHTRFYTP